MPRGGSPSQHKGSLSRAPPVESIGVIFDGRSIGWG